MFIPGIGPYKISDLATNIIKNELLLYTHEQCALLDIPTHRVNPGKCWEASTGKFISRYADLPVCPSGPVILVPKNAVRTRLVPDHRTFYSQFVLDYLEAELISANDSLVYVLKNGHKKVFRKDLRERYSFTQEQLYQFGKKHPEILAKYKESLPKNARPISDLDIEWRQQEQRSVDVADLGDALDNIRPGRADAEKFHVTILGILEAIFYPSLTRPVKEQEIDEGRKRLDINFSNSADGGFFSSLTNRHKVFAPYIVVECKNYRQDPENPELDQLRGRFSRKRGHFGLLICRSVDRPELMVRRCRDFINNSNEAVILVLEDADIKELLRLKSSKGEKAVSEYMQAKLDEILM
jgi:hypothetical protein